MSGIRYTTESATVTKIVEAAFSVMHHNADRADEAAQYEETILREKVAAILNGKD